MEPLLKQIKTELKPIAKAENWKAKHINNHLQEILEYTDYFTLNRKKHYLTLRFILQKREHSLSFIYRYVYNSKTITVDETHSFAEANKKVLPGVSPLDREKLFDIYHYGIEDKTIRNEVPLEEQKQTLMEVFKNNYQTIVNHAKNIHKLNKIPD